MNTLCVIHMALLMKIIEVISGVFLEFGLVSHVVLRTISRFCKVWLM